MGGARFGGSLPLSVLSECGAGGTAPWARAARRGAPVRASRTRPTPAPTGTEMSDMDITGLIKQFVKFAGVGGIAFLVDYGVLMLLSQALGWNALLSSAISYVISVVFNYYASMHFVFKRRDDLSVKRELFLFVALSLVGLAINSALMAAGTALFGEGALAVTGTKVVATVVVALWNFWSRKHWLEAK